VHKHTFTDLQSTYVMCTWAIAALPVQLYRQAPLPPLPVCNGRWPSTWTQSPQATSPAPHPYASQHWKITTGTDTKDRIEKGEEI